MKNRATEAKVASFLPDFAFDNHGNRAEPQRLVGPAYRDEAARHGARAGAEAYLAGQIKSGGHGIRGAIPTSAQAQSEGRAKMIAQWPAEDAKKPLPLGFARCNPGPSFITLFVTHRA
jgi:cytochrome c